LHQNANNSVSAPALIGIQYPLTCRDDIGTEVVLERREGIEVGAVPAVERVRRSGRKILVEEVRLGCGCLCVHRSIHKARLVSVFRLAHHVFVAGREVAGTGLAGVEGVEDELLLLLLLLPLLQQSLLLVVLLQHELVRRGAHTSDHHVSGADGGGVASGGSHEGCTGQERHLVVAIRAAAAGAVAAAASVGAGRLTREGKALLLLNEGLELGLSKRQVVEGARVLANAVDLLLDALQLAVRPAVNAVVTAELLERSEADAEVLGDLLFGDVEVLLEFLECDGSWVGHVVCSNERVGKEEMKV